MNTQAEKTLLEKLKALPPTRLAEVEDFGDFLKGREERTVTRPPSPREGIREARRLE